MAEQKPEEPIESNEKADTSEPQSEPQIPPIVKGGAETPQGNPEQNGQENETHNLAEQIKHTDHIIARSAVVTAFLTLVLAALAGLQAYSFIESERAVFILKDLHFAYGDPTGIESSRDLVVVFRNVGKHVSKVGRMEAAPIYGVIKKSLPEILKSHEHLTTIFVVPPVAPDSDNTNFAEVRRIKPPVDDATFMSGLLDGTIPLWFYGFLEYDIGYPWFWSGKLGFCMKYVPPAKRRPGMGQFTTCEYPEYTYTK